MRLDPGKLGLAGGILWGLAMFGVTLVSVPTGYGAEFLRMMGSVYPGYQVSYAGSIVGLIYGFVDGFIAVYLFAWLYLGLVGEPRGR